jgi:histone acetyltransferase (RNA polymerase elongator complex component)
MPMEKIREVNRRSEGYRISIEEFRKGEWLKDIPANINKVDVIYMGGVLTIKTMKQGVT